MGELLQEVSHPHTWTLQCTSNSCNKTHRMEASALEHLHTRCHNLVSIHARRPYVMAAGFKHWCRNKRRCPHRVDPGLCVQVKARGELRTDDVSIAAHLLRLRDPATRQPLPDALLAGEFGMFFSAGLETSGNAISWTL